MCDCFLFFFSSILFSGLFSIARLSVVCSHVPKQPEDAAGRQKPQEQHWSVSHGANVSQPLSSDSGRGGHKVAAVSSAAGISKSMAMQSNLALNPVTCCFFCFVFLSYVDAGHLLLNLQLSDLQCSFIAEGSGMSCFQSLSPELSAVFLLCSCKPPVKTTEEPENELDEATVCLAATSIL